MKTPAAHMFQLAFYSRYFDINTEDFLANIQLALNPFNPAKSQPTDATDLYGFLWINATLVLLMFVSSTGANLLALWLHSDDTDVRYEYNFRVLTLSIALFYGYTALVPALFCAFLSYLMEFKERVPLTLMMSIYSYANVLWVPTTVANVFLAVLVSRKSHRAVLSLLQWLFVVVSGVLSGLSIVLKLRPTVLQNVADGNEHEAKRAKFLILGLIMAHGLFSVVIKSAFFDIH